MLDSRPAEPSANNDDSRNNRSTSAVRLSGSKYLAWLLVALSIKKTEVLTIVFQAQKLNLLKFLKTNALCME